MRFNKIITVLLLWILSGQLLGQSTNHKVLEKWLFISNNFEELNEISNDKFNILSLDKDTIEFLLHTDSSTGWMIHKKDSVLINYKYYQKELEFKRYDQVWNFEIKSKMQNKIIIELVDHKLRKLIRKKK